MKSTRKLEESRHASQIYDFAVFANRLLFRIALVVFALVVSIHPPPSSLLRRRCSSMLFELLIFVLGFACGCALTFVAFKSEGTASTLHGIPVPWPLKHQFDEVFAWHNNTKITLKRLQDKISKQETQLQQLNLSQNELSERLATLQESNTLHSSSLHRTASRHVQLTSSSDSTGTVLHPIRSSVATRTHTHTHTHTHTCTVIQ
jgi:hypothetical protein